MKKRRKNTYVVVFNDLALKTKIQIKSFVSLFRSLEKNMRRVIHHFPTIWISTRESKAAFC